MKILNNGQNDIFLDKLTVGIDGILTEDWIENDWNLEDWNNKMKT